jgi:hypothetical protein
VFYAKQPYAIQGCFSLTFDRLSNLCNFFSISLELLIHGYLFLRSGFKTFNRVQGQGGLERPTAGIL